MCRPARQGYRGFSAGRSETLPAVREAHAHLPSAPSIKLCLKQPPPHAVGRNGEEGKEIAGSSPRSLFPHGAGPPAGRPPPSEGRTRRARPQPGAAVCRAGVGTGTASRAGRSQLRQRALQTPCRSPPAVTGRARACLAAGAPRRRAPAAPAAPARRGRETAAAAAAAWEPSPPSCPLPSSRALLPSPITKKAGYKQPLPAPTPQAREVSLAHSPAPPPRPRAAAAPPPPPPAPRRAAPLARSRSLPSASGCRIHPPGPSAKRGGPIGIALIGERRAPPRLDGRGQGPPRQSEAARGGARGGSSLPTCGGGREGWESSLFSRCPRGTGGLALRPPRPPPPVPQRPPPLPEQDRGRGSPGRGGLKLSAASRGGGRGRRKEGGERIGGHREGARRGPGRGRAARRCRV